MRIDTVKNDVEKIKEIILKTHKGKEDDFNSVVSLAMMQSANVPHKKELNKDLQFVLNAISELESKITPEINVSKKNTYLISGNAVKVGKGAFKLGDDVYDKDFSLLGSVVAINALQKTLTIKDINGNLMKLSFDHIVKEGIGTLPF